MTDIVVVSDTHGITSFVNKLTIKHPNAYLYLHAGDSGVSSDELFPFETVKGNCDYIIKNMIKVIDVLGVKILMFHGDKFLLDEDMLVSYAQNYEAKILIHGHTHIPFYKNVNGVHILCPGSAYYPRVTKPTYAIIHINRNNKYEEYDEKQIQVEFLEYK